MKIRRALISVSDKNGLSTLALGLHALGVELISTSGTAAFLEQAGVPVTTVETLTGSAELLGGRVKTLHASLHAAILARRDHADDMASLEAAGIEPIDLVVCNLYPFRSVAARRGVSEAEVIANIDIGGPTMVRAAAKNFHSVAVVTEPDRYGFMLDELNSSGGELSIDTRRDLAGEAFSHVASYDSAVAAWFTDTEPFPDRMTIDLVKVGDLAYGENPHQRAAFYREAGARRHVLSRIDQVSGKPLSFNNLADLQAARTIAAAFQLPACAIVKHANPCG
jgi:phosphoribosylaminoimidazolecarboxamide formyltransferase/IMP cyclohydrolase